MIFACAQLDSRPPATTLVVDIFSGPFLVKTLLLSQTTTEGLPGTSGRILACYRCIAVRRRSRAALRSSQVFLDWHLLCAGRQKWCDRRCRDRCRRATCSSLARETWEPRDRADW